MGRQRRFRRAPFPCKAGLSPVSRSGNSPRASSHGESGASGSFALHGRTQRRASFVLFALARMVSLPVLGNPGFACSRLLCAAELRGILSYRDMPAWLAHVSSVALFIPKQSGSTAFLHLPPLAVRSPDKQAERYGHGSPYTPWKKEFHPCVCAFWERLSLYAPACCPPAAAGITDVVIALPTMRPAAAAAAASRAAMLAMKVLWQRPLAPLPAPCRPRLCRVDRIRRIRFAATRNGTRGNDVRSAAHCALKKCD